MIRAVIVLLAMVVVIPAVSNGEFGAAGVAIVIAAVLLALGASERKDAKAWMNFRDYWANGGPNK